MIKGLDTRKENYTRKNTSEEKQHQTNEGLSPSKKMRKKFHIKGKNEIKFGKKEEKRDKVRKGRNKQTKAEKGEKRKKETKKKEETRKQG
jgi:hypothetical protein